MKEFNKGWPVLAQTVASSAGTLKALIGYSGFAFQIFEGSQDESEIGFSAQWHSLEWRCKYKELTKAEKKHDKYHKIADPVVGEPI